MVINSSQAYTQGVYNRVNLMSSKSNEPSVFLQHDSKKVGKQQQLETTEPN